MAAPEALATQGAKALAATKLTSHLVLNLTHTEGFDIKDPVKYMGMLVARLELNRPNIYLW